MVQRARPTLRDVSRLSGVSIYSVSRALSGQDGVSEETRARVRAAAREVGYVANQLARSLKGDSSRTIGILAARTANPYYATLVGSMDHELRQEGFQSIIADTAEHGVHDLERETNFVGALLEQRVAAVVVTHSLATANLELLAGWRIPLVFVDCVVPPGYDAYPAVIADNEAAGHLVGDHLAGHGYRHWAFLGYPPLWSSRIPRERGFAASARRHGAELDVIECGNDADTAYDAVLAYLGSAAGADALYCANEPLLEGALRAFVERRIRMPQDTAVISFDEFPWAALLRPAITVVDQHPTRVGQLAAALLLAQLGGPDRPPPRPVPERLLVPPDLIVRRSCGCPARPRPAGPGKGTRL